MAEAIENDSCESMRNKMSEIFKKALRNNGDFDDSLKDVTFEELQILSQITKEHLIDHKKKYGPVGKTIIDCRTKVVKVVIEKEETNTSDREILQRIVDQITQAMSKYKPLIPKGETPDGYMKEFLAYLATLDEMVRGPNATDLKIKSYVESGKKKITPDKHPEHKVGISVNDSFEESLAFIQEHINDAIIRNNIKETDKRKKQFNDGH